MTRTRIAIALGVAAFAASASLFGGLLADSPSAGSSRPTSPGTAGRLLEGFSLGDTKAYVSYLERRVAADSSSVRELTLLGLAYQQRARETGDPSFYPRSKRALLRALALGRRSDLGGEQFLATTGLASLAASQHRFREARRLAERARHLSPGSAAPWGILGDALVELGRYGKAFAAFDRMVSLKPSLTSYARVAYARELVGDVRGAEAAMSLAVEAGASSSEHSAWALVQLGNLRFDSGRINAAGKEYRAALTRFPGYVHAEAGLARVAAARGRYAGAIKLYRRAVARLPLPQYAAALGDVLHVSGRQAEARRAYALVEAIDRVFRASGVRTELETALFDLDHGRRLHDALARAREALRERPSIEAEDVVGWALAKNGHCAEARKHSVRALRLGTKDAVKLFHRGIIERCLGDRAAAHLYFGRALAINPHFSIRYAPIAEEAVQ